MIPLHPQVEASDEGPAYDEVAYQQRARTSHPGPWADGGEDASHQTLTVSPHQNQGMA